MKYNGNAMEINRAKLGEIDLIRILFHEARPPRRVFPLYFTSLFHGAKRSIFPLYFYRISFPYNYPFLIQIHFQFRNTNFLEVKNTCCQCCICFSRGKYFLKMEHGARST